MRVILTIASIIFVALTSSIETAQQLTEKRGYSVEDVKRGNPRIMDSFESWDCDPYDQEMVNGQTLDTRARLSFIKKKLTTSETIKPLTAYQLTKRASSYGVSQGRIAQYVICTVRYIAKSFTVCIDQTCVTVLAFEKKRECV